jgi:hypothetical protein
VASEELTPEDTALLAELEALLRDPTMWAQPGPDLEDQIVAAVITEAEGSSTYSYHVYRWQSRARRWVSIAGAAVVGAAAAALITVAVTRDTQSSPDATIALAGTELSPGITGEARLTTESSGVKIELKVPGLPRRDGGEFYQVWLKNCDGSQLVPAGSFHELDDAVAWAGVSPDDFPLLTVTREAAAPPKDAAQGSSGEVVAKGAIGECPA